MTINTEERYVQVIDIRIVDKRSNAPYVLAVTDFSNFTELRNQIIYKIPFGSLRIDYAILYNDSKEPATITTYDEAIIAGSGKTHLYRLVRDGEILTITRNLSAVRGRFLTPKGLLLSFGNDMAFPASKIKKTIVESYYGDPPLFKIKSRDEYYPIYNLEDALPHLKELPYGIRIEYDGADRPVYWEVQYGTGGEFYEVHQADDDRESVPYTQCFCKDYLPIRMALYEKVLPEIEYCWSNGVCYQVNRAKYQDQKYIEENCMIDE